MRRAYLVGRGPAFVRYPLARFPVGPLLFVGLAALVSSHLFPFFPLFWALPFFVVPALRLAATWGVPIRGAAPGGNRKERELLEALERYGEITAARAALETSLSVAEADEMLSELAAEGHVRVRAHEGTLAYAMWEPARRDARSGKLPGSEEPASR